MTKDMPVMTRDEARNGSVASLLALHLDTMEDAEDVNASLTFAVEVDGEFLVYELQYIGQGDRV